MIEVVSRGTLRSILLEHAESPSRLRYYELPERIGLALYAHLSAEWKVCYEGDQDSIEIAPRSMLAPPGTRDGWYTRFTRLPGSYDAWVVERA